MNKKQKQVVLLGLVYVPLLKFSEKQAEDESSETTTLVGSGHFLKTKRTRSLLLPIKRNAPHGHRKVISTI